MQAARLPHRFPVGRHVANQVARALTARALTTGPLDSWLVAGTPRIIGSSGNSIGADSAICSRDQSARSQAHTCSRSGMWSSLRSLQLQSGCAARPARGTSRHRHRTAATEARRPKLRRLDLLEQIPPHPEPAAVLRRRQPAAMYAVLDRWARNAQQLGDLL